MNRSLLRLAFVAGAANCLLFTVYRLLCFHVFGSSASGGEMLRALVYGFRLDLALLGCELGLTGIILLLFRRVRRRWLWWWVWLLTGLHGVSCLANLITFSERGQSAGELLLPYLALPGQIFLAVMPLFEERWLLAGVLVAVLAAYGWFGMRVSKRFGTLTVDSWAGQRQLAGTLALAVLPVTLALQPVRIKRAESGANVLGWTVQFSESKYYTTFSRRALNEAVANPVLEFAAVQVPSHLKSGGRYHYSEAEAQAIYFRDTGRRLLDARHPLVTPVRGVPGLGIENVIILQVEGLSGSILEQERNGRAVTPFLRQLARESLYFPNTLQSANFTAGGLFAAVASVPKATYDEAKHRFTAYEMSGVYSSLPRLLGSSNYTHFFCEGFRHGSADSLSFMAHQGFDGYGYEHFRDTLRRKGQLREGDTLLGIFDDYFLRECAELILQCPTRFTAHLVTCTTHSPWVVPATFPRVFEKPELNAFAYLDAAIAAFVERLKSAPEVWERTLLIVTADHTSVTFGDTLLERLRIPLMFHAPRLRPEPARADWASHLDILPTTLALLGQDRWFCGMGNNLLEPAAGQAGIVSGTTQNGCYLAEGYLFQYHPHDERTALWAMGSNAEVDVTEKHPDVLERLRAGYFAKTELANRLGRARRIFPVAREESVRLSASVAQGDRMTANPQLP